MQSGRLRAFAADANGKEFTLGIYGAGDYVGDYVGEMSLDGGSRSANVKTLEATTCAMVSRLLRDLQAGGYVDMWERRLVLPKALPLLGLMGLLE